MMRRSNQQGFAMPVIILLIALMAITSYTILAQVTNGLGLSYRESYLQIARVASRSAIDYAQEQYDNSNCGNYTGSAEQNIISNSRYRVTIKDEVISTSSDGLSKIVKGTGSVYLPKNSITARYVFSVNSEIVNTFATCKTPSDYGPLVWLDASDTSTLIGQAGSGVHKTTAFGNAADTTRDTLQELASDGSQTSASWQNPNMQMSTCAVADFNNTTCTTNSTKYVYDGAVFQGVNVPKNAIILSATLTLVGATPSGSGGTETNKVYGLYQSSSNPYTPLFNSAGSNQLKTPLTTASRHTTSSASFSTNNLPPGNSVTVNVASVVQEMVNQANWGDNIPDGQNDQFNMGFGVQYVSGPGSRNLKKDGLKLDISYLSLGPTYASNGGNVSQWNDKSGNGNNAVYAFGNYATRQDNQINSNTIVRFNGGTMVSPLALSLSGKREMTTFAVVKPKFDTSDNDGRIVSGTSTSVTSDLVSGSSLVPLMRYGNNDGFSNNYSGNSSTYRTNYTCTSSCENVPDLLTSLFDINATNKVNSTLRLNGSEVAKKTDLAPVGSPYLFSLNQFYYGGTRGGTLLAPSGVNYLNGDFAEIIIYDKALSCYQIESIENYLRAKWGLSGVAYNDSCPPPTIPTL